MYSIYKKVIVIYFALIVTTYKGSTRQTEWSRGEILWPSLVVNVRPRDMFLHRPLPGGKSVPIPLNCQSFWSRAIPAPCLPNRASIECGGSTNKGRLLGTQESSL